MIQIDTNTSSFISTLTNVSQRVVNKAFAHSANSALSATRTFILKAFVQQGMKRASIAPRLSIFKAYPNNLRSRLVDVGRKVPISVFSPRSKVVRTARGKRQGVSVSMNGTRELVPGGFLVQMKSGKAGVFKRVGAGRLPIKQVVMSKLIEMFNANAALSSSARAYATQKFHESFTRDWEFYKAKEKGK